jgi:ribosomal 30S subunit maturation factor RimM
MDIKDLLVIGRLGKIITDNDEYQFIKNDNFQLAFVEKLAKVFLIFTEHRVFFVEIKDFCMINSKNYISFNDEGIKEELKNYKSCKIAVPIDDFYSQEYDEDYNDVRGFTAVDNGNVLGTVEDFIYNPNQRIIVIESPEGKEILIPEVDYYINDIDFEKRVIEFQNSESLLNL